MSGEKAAHCLSYELAEGRARRAVVGRRRHGNARRPRWLMVVWMPGVVSMVLSARCYSSQTLCMV